MAYVKKGGTREWDKGDADSVRVRVSVDFE